MSDRERRGHLRERGLLVSVGGSRLKVFWPREECFLYRRYTSCSQTSSGTLPGTCACFCQVRSRPVGSQARLVRRLQKLLGFIQPALLDSVFVGRRSLDGVDAGLHRTCGFLLVAEARVSAAH